MKDKYSLRNLIQRTYDNIPCDTESEKAAVMTRIFDVEGKVDLSGSGAYRKADIVSLIESAVENKAKNMLAKTDNLEKVVATTPTVKALSTKPSIVSIVYGMAKDYTKGLLFDIPRKALIGSLPARIQKKLGKKYDEDPLSYTTYNIITEALANTGIVTYLSSTNNAVAIGTGIGYAVYSIVNTIIRVVKRFGDDESIGSLPIIASYNLINSVHNKYLGKKKELTAILKQKSLQIETTESKQLPSPERKAIVNTELVEEFLGRKLNK